MGDSRENYKYLKGRHRCVQCRTVDAYTLNGRTYCADCAEWRREYYRQRAHRPDVKQKYNTSVKAKKEERLAQGLCPRCGRKAEPPYVTCSKCRADARAKYRSKNPLPPWSEDLCSRCHKLPPVKGKRLCEKCYRDSLVSASKATEARRRSKHVEV